MYTKKVNFLFQIKGVLTLFLVVVILQNIFDFFDIEFHLIVSLVQLRLRNTSKVFHTKVYNTERKNT